VLLLVACGGAQPSTTPEKPTPAKSVGVPATFAKLFQQGSKWSFPTAVSSVVHDEKTTETKTTGTLACEVAVTSPRPGGWNTRLECKAAPELPTPFAMELVATSSGLWQLVEDGELKPELRLLAEPPVEEFRPGYVHEGAEASGGMLLTKKGSRWCFGETGSMAGDTSQWTMCVRAGDFVGGTSMTANSNNITTITWGDHED
jgi:hypothetical protein